MLMYALAKYQASQQDIISGHYKPISQTPSEWSFTGGPIVVPFYMLTVLIFASRISLTDPESVLGHHDADEEILLHV